MSLQLVNMDRHCADAGWKMAEELWKNKKDGKPETHITKSLGVLQEDGLYAFFLYQLKEDSFGIIVQKHCNCFLRSSSISLITQEIEDNLQAVRDLTGNLSNMMLAKSLLEKILIYTRYHLKAKEKAGDQP